MIPVKVENNTSLDQVQDALNCVGYAVVEDVLDEASLAATRDRMYRVQERILTEIGKERLARAGELGVPGRVLPAAGQAIVSEGARLVLREFRCAYLKARHETIAFKRICLFCKNV